ncbi:thiamine phosphate synthase [Paenactinomyces guangxiensis]|uniref:Thiamine-phosphate synthase n=1 Tax=Paenactinomyces guangxiensis TaxID=1490290 RepID=A0A7W1WRE6_9BACL|nr:thiamine phosphate synthase [Paenactinomyces guangxiensis]MBA4494534.1 thiamine phosphate synthase [Paenactinomyces guangxiensis]MBH8591704.1 thiamine phosphate synthase [Paenactinomyces guangxiensis]
MTFTRDNLYLYFIMGSQDCPNHNPVEVLKQAIQGGITCFQYREKNSGLNMRETVRLGKELRNICRQHKIPFIVNDRVDLALILEATGVHVGQEDLPAAEVRRIIGPSRILGVSAETPEEAKHAFADGADYIGVGPMFSTSSKPDAGQPIGPAAISRIRNHLPFGSLIVGIGGITPKRAPDVLAAGADGVAVISAISKDKQPAHAAQAFLQTMRNSTKL